jgi:hypothetical protein
MCGGIILSPVIITMLDTTPEPEVRERKFEVCHGCADKVKAVIDGDDGK